MLPWLHIQGRLRVCVPMMVDGNISGEGGIAGCTPGGTAPTLRPSPHRPPGVTQKRGKNLHNEKMCHFGNGDPARQGPWMAMWVVQAHREKQIGCMGAAEFGLDSTEVQGWALCPVALGLSCCQGTSETGNVSRPSAHGTLTDL